VPRVEDADSILSNEATRRRVAQELFQADWVVDRPIKKSSRYRYSTFANSTQHWDENSPATVDDVASRKEPMGEPYNVKGCSSYFYHYLSMMISFGRPQ
jgi:hypothetical protein